MGSVYLGTDPAGVPVVLKVPHAQSRDAAVALADEARTGMRLRHPAIVETLDFFVENGTSVLVVAYIDGMTLFELRRRGPLPASAIAALGEQLAGALEAIHNATDESGRPLAMLHRDISPNNVLVDEKGQARLIDLGIARSADRKQKSTQVGMVKGTLRYLAPEILAGADHSRASDLWALGLTLWEAALGRYAVPGETTETLRAAVMGTITKLHPGEHMEPMLKEALDAFLAPVERRLQTARAASAVMARLASRFTGGHDVLGATVRATRRAPSPMIGEVTEIVERAAARVDAAQREPASLGSLTRENERDSVFTSTAPISDYAPTLQMPAVSQSELEREPRRAAVPIDAAPTMQMPLWTSTAEAAANASTAPSQPPTRARQAEMNDVTDPNAPTRLSMPAVKLPSPSASPPSSDGRAASLFLDIVVIDDLEDPHKKK